MYKFKIVTVYPSIVFGITSFVPLLDTLLYLSKVILVPSSFTVYTHCPSELVILCAFFSFSTILAICFVLLCIKILLMVSIANIINDKLCYDLKKL